MPRVAVLILAAAFGLAGCAGEVTGTAGAAARVAIRPSDEAYKAAVQGLTPAEREMLKKGFGFTLDTLLVTPTPVEIMKWSRARADAPAVVDISSFVRFLNLQAAVKGPVRVNLASVRVLAGVTHQADTFTPVFRIQAEVEPSSSSVTTVTAVGGGPDCKKSIESQLSSPEITNSEQIAFMRALLRMLLKVSVQLQQAG